MTSKIPKYIKQIKKDGFIAFLRERKNRHQRKWRYQSMLKINSYKERFEKIYEQNLWNSKETKSGEGSEIDYTESLRNHLPNLIEKYEIKSIVDAPCGDFNWIKLVLLKVNIQYTGLDIVETIIRENQKQFASGKINFSQADICRDPLPQCDLLIVRDFLIHLSFEDINQFLQNISQSKYKYLLTNSYIVKEDFINRDIITGDGRVIDMFKPPFEFSQASVLERIQDYPEGYLPKREMVMFYKKDVPQQIRTIDA